MNLILFPNSSATSLADVGLSFDDMFALGAASGNFNKLSRFLAILCFGTLAAMVFFPTLAILEIFEFFFFFKINVIGPGQKALYSFLKLVFIIASFFKAFKFLK